MEQRDKPFITHLPTIYRCIRTGAVTAPSQDILRSGLVVGNTQLSEKQAVINRLHPPRPELPPSTAFRGLTKKALRTPKMSEHLLRKLCGAMASCDKRFITPSDGPLTAPQVGAPMWPPRLNKLRDHWH